MPYKNSEKKYIMMHVSLFHQSPFSIYIGKVLSSFNLVVVVGGRGGVRGNLCFSTGFVSGDDMVTPHKQYFYFLFGIVLLT